MNLHSPRGTFLSCKIYTCMDTAMFLQNYQDQQFLLLISSNLCCLEQIHWPSALYANMLFLHSSPPKAVDRLIAPFDWYLGLPPVQEGSFCIQDIAALSLYSRRKEDASSLFICSEWFSLNTDLLISLLLKLSLYLDYWEHWCFLCCPEDKKWLANTVTTLYIHLLCRFLLWLERASVP